MQLHNIAKSGIAAALVSLAVCVAPWRSTQAQEPAPPPAAAVEGAVPEGAGVDAEGVETLTRGPVHEAFAAPSAADPEPTATVKEKPPEPIDEVAPDFKPEGAIWIGTSPRKGTSGLAACGGCPRRACAGSRPIGPRPMAAGSACRASGLVRT
jgi:hypothetical protein